MRVRYSMNWMGPISIGWYKDRGLTRKQTFVFDGQPTECDSVTVHFSAGRIDVYDGSDYGDEISVPPMLSEDWNRFDDWLLSFETDATWTLEQLVELYEKDNPKITWWKENDAT